MKKTQEPYCFTEVRTFLKAKTIPIDYRNSVF